MQRSTPWVYRATVVAASALVLSGCDGRSPTAATPSQADAAFKVSRAAAGDRLARAVGRALASPSLRAELRDALRESPWNEHKLVLADYTATPRGQRLVDAAAASAGVPPAVMRQWVALLGPTDLYLPVHSQRRSWAGGADLVVGVNLDDDDTRLTGYAPDGSVRQLNARAGIPTQTVVLLAPAEPRTRRVAPGMRQDVGCAPYAVVECNIEGGGANGYTGPQVNSFVAHVSDGWGDPEIRIVHSTRSYNGTLTNIWSHDFDGSPVDELQLVEQPATFAPSRQFTTVEVIERDGFLTGDDDYWGRTDVLAASGSMTRIYGQCGTVFVDGNWQAECASYPPYPINPVWTDQVLTTEIRYYY